MAAICYYGYMRNTDFFGFWRGAGQAASKNLLIKKIITLAFAVIVCAVYLIPFGPKGQNLPFVNYFNSFESPQPFAKAQTRLILPDGVKVASYDARNEVFIIRQNLYEGYFDYLKDFYSEEELQAGECYLYGLASKDQVLVTPSYISIIAIKGDYAIAIKGILPSGGSDMDDLQLKLGLVKFRGDNAGDRTDFKSDYSASLENIAVSQMKFVGDRYVAVINDINDMDPKADTVTFYDYKSSHKLLEAFKVRADITVNFVLQDGYLAAIKSDKADFYKLNVIDEKGYLVLNDTYTPFPEDKDGALRPFITTMVSYIGNGWFMRQGYIQAKKEEINPDDLKYIQGKLILVDSVDRLTGEKKEYYLLMRSDRYNAKTKVSLSNGLLVPDMVANKYNADGTRDIADLINSTMEKGPNDKFVYYPPSMPVGALPKDGMSIVYYYLFPYDNQPERYVISFVMMDQNANIFHPQKNIFMPLLIVDDIAVQVSDPDYEIAYGHAQIIDNKNRVKVFKEYMAGEYGYINVAYSSGALIVSQYNLRKMDEEKPEMYYGAFDRNGKQITPFKYLELSLFYGDYAIGMNKVNDEYRYYRIDKEGNEVRLDDVLAVKNGVYITADSQNRVGLKTYAGQTLLANEYDSIDVMETFLTDGKFQKSVVAAVKNNRGYIFELE